MSFGRPSQRRRRMLMPARQPLGAADMPQPVDVIAQLLPAAKALFDPSAAESVEVLQAKIVNHRRIRDSVPEPLRGLYVNKIAVLEAKYRAALQARGLEREGEASTRDWRNVGKGLGVTGILVGGALAVLLLSLATRRK
jgi:hypothetical protein